MSSSREADAIQAYYNLLHGKGADDAIMAQRDALLAELSPLLADLECTSTAYRQAVDDCLADKPAPRWPELLTIIREFYPFWRGDVKAVMQYADTVGFELHPISWQPAVIDLQSVWPALQSEKFETSELWALNGYVKALKSMEHKQEMDIELRTRMAKLMLLRLREAPMTEKNAFRITADATLPLFNLKNTRHLFLNAVREFYYFWAAHPDAVEMLKQLQPPEIM
ncbi:hypothetical protein [Methylophilus sp. QUAN]|uniref:hypothetical protein n=1 Tax=Methylophilus sp. QUAN TaxID=2781020 RepID=UPI00188F3E8C|nr:hypothetical protein [Methylophilus sp. QUAN]MBF4991292.1 hypothetical protein [Methylophilus sp. QUAN]